MSNDRRVGFRSEKGSELIAPDSYDDVAIYVARAIRSIRPNRPFLNATRSRIIAPNLISLIINDRSMVSVLEKEDESDPRKSRIGGVGVALAAGVYRPDLLLPDTAEVFIFALDRKHLREEGDERDLLLMMANRAKADGYPGGLINEPGYSNL